MIRAGLLAALLAAAGAQEQSGAAAGELLSKVQMMFPGGAATSRAGQWVCLRVISEGREGYFRIGILGDEALPDGSRGTWYELAFGGHPNGAVVAMKYLSAAADPRDGRRVVKSVVRIAGGKAQELPEREVKRLRSATAVPAATGTGAAPVEELRTVPAGTFKCKRFDLGFGTLWLSDAAPIFHVVAGELGGTVFELYDGGDHVADWVGTPEQRLDLKPDGGVVVHDLDAGAGAKP